MYWAKTTLVLLQLVGDEKNINMNTTKSPEFDGWTLGEFLVSQYGQVVSFKKDVYRKAMKEFAQAIFGTQNIA